ncbi:phosphotransferase family protein [Rhodococcus coprophilus]|uniref:phosphotransferase family protein n=1 Tax=Rhodococcus coprophilus TaxID=38310 RepID=UPI0034039088
MSETFEDALAERLSTVLGAACVFTGVERLTGGASRETWSLTTKSDPALPPELILRRDPPGREDPGRMSMEAAAFVEAGRVGVPVPEIVDNSGGEPLPGIGSYLVMSRLPGEALPQRLLRDERFGSVRARLPYDLGRTLGRLHRMDPVAVPGLPDHDPLEFLLGEYTRTGGPLPALEAAFSWLRDNRPPATRKSVVHGDFRNGNILVDEDGIRGVLDWELAHLGDPMEDLGWLCTKTWRFGSPHPVGGFGSRDDLFRGYADESGVSPDPDVVHWWEVFGSLRWAVICRMQAMRADDGGDNTLELLAIGRRVAECERDLLDLLGVPASATGDVVRAGDDPADDLFGTPRIGELLRAVQDFVVDASAGADPRSVYRSRVAAHVLGIAARESEVGYALREEFRTRLGELGYRTESELALGLRAGDITLEETPVGCVVRDLVDTRLRVANPRY